MDKNQFIAKFEQSLEALAKSEKVTRSELLALSRSTLEALHSDVEGIRGDIGYVNRLLGVLTPMNRKTAILYFKEFTGFKFDEAKLEFTGKDKKHYEEKKAQCLEFLADPLNNVWSWAERNVEVEKKAFDINKKAEQFLKQADKEGFKKVDVLKAIMAAGVSVDELIEFMGTVEGVELDVKA